MGPNDVLISYEKGFENSISVLVLDCVYWLHFDGYSKI